MCVCVCVCVCACVRVYMLIHMSKRPLRRANNYVELELYQD